MRNQNSKNYYYQHIVSFKCHFFSLQIWNPSVMKDKIEFLNYGIHSIHQSIDYICFQYIHELFILILFSNSFTLIVNCNHRRHISTNLLIFHICNEFSKSWSPIFGENVLYINSDLCSIVITFVKLLFSFTCKCY